MRNYEEFKKIIRNDGVAGSSPACGTSLFKGLAICARWTSFAPKRPTLPPALKSPVRASVAAVPTGAATFAVCLAAAKRGDSATALRLWRPIGRTGSSLGAVQSRRHVQERRWRTAGLR